MHQTMGSRWVVLLGCLSLLFGAFLVSPRPARACGGFFCQSVPVVQSGEQIVYAIDADGALTMSVRIYYVGAAPEFAWILPVPVTPELALGTTALFDELENATRPSFRLTTRVDGTCRSYPRCEYPPRPDAGWYADAASVSDAAAVSFDAGAGPVIYSQSSLGPYETVVIGGASATEIHDWLTTHGYDLPASAIPLLDGYVASGQRFVALRLRTDASVSEIQPITLRGLGMVEPCLPIRLTSIATTPDLPITAFFLAHRRATPRNYSLIETPYPAPLFFGSISYAQWVSNEADDMGGQAFIADYAGDTPTASFPIADLSALATETSPAAVVRGLMASGYAADGQLLAILSRFVVPPTGMDPQSFYNCLVGAGDACGAPASFDPAGLVAAIDLAIAQPRRDAQAMLDDHPYTTRLFTTMSAEEMTLDPEFVLDEGLDRLSNVHTAVWVTECDAEHFVGDAAQHLELPSGESVPVTEARPSVTDAAYCAGSGGWIPGSRPPSTTPGGGGGGCSASASPRRRAPGAVSLVVIAGVFALALRRRR